MPIDKPRAEVAAMSLKWQKCRDVMAGEDEVKFRGDLYLPRLGGQTEEEYKAYLCRALFYNGTGRTKSALVGLVLAKDPNVEFPDAYDAQLDDVTMDCTPLKAFVATALNEVIEVGRFGFLIDMPDGDNADQRPYWVGYLAEDIFHWSSITRGGDRVMTLVILRENSETVTGTEFDVTKKVQYRVLQLVDPLGPSPTYTSTVYTPAPNDKTVLVAGPTVVPLRRGVPLDTIPFVFVGPHNVAPEITKPPLLDMVHVNLSHYRTSADLEHGRHFTALPTPWVVGLSAQANGGALKIGAGTAWELQGDGAKAGMLEFTGQGLGALDTALEQKEKLMAVLGAQIVDHSGTGQNETAESVRARQASSYATLMTIADTMSLAITKGLRIHAWWLGIDKPESAKPPVGLTLNTAFFAPRLDAPSIQALMLAQQSGQISFKTLYWNLTRGDIARPDVDVEDEQQDILDDEQFALAHAPAPVVTTGPNGEVIIDGVVQPAGTPPPDAKKPGAKPMPPVKKAA